MPNDFRYGDLYDKKSRKILRDDKLEFYLIQELSGITRRPSVYPADIAK